MHGKWLRKPTAGPAVVFVHGILSSGQTCWLNANGTYWPSLLEDAPDLKNVGIYVFTYQTDIFSGSYRLSDVVDALKEHLRLDDVFETAQVVFVCHSMGGIVVRKFLVERAAELIDKEMDIGLFLLASPSLGSSYATWLAPLARFLGHSQADALRFQQSNAWLNDLDKEFQNLKESGQLKISGKELVEDKFVILSGLWRKQVVEPFSGARYFGEPFKVPRSDHFSIAKPDHPRAIQHRLLCRFIEELHDRRQSTKNVMLAPLVAGDTRQTGAAIQKTPEAATQQPNDKKPELGHAEKIEKHRIELTSELLPVEGDRGLLILIDEIRDSVQRNVRFEVIVNIAALTEARLELQSLENTEDLSFAGRERRAALRQIVRRFSIFDKIPGDQFIAELITVIAIHGWRSYAVASTEQLAECALEAIRLYGPSAWPEGKKFEVFPASGEWYASFHAPSEEVDALVERLGVPAGYMVAGYGLRLDDFSTAVLRTRTIPSLAFEYFRLKYAVGREVLRVEEFFDLLALKVGIG